MKLINILAISLLLVSNMPSAHSEEIKGKVNRVKDGDSIIVWNSEIRLLDIDAFESSQQCMRNNNTYSCGAQSANVLRNLILDKVVTCRGTSVDRYERLLATCYLGEININEFMVASGWAVNYNEGKVYTTSQEIASNAKRGAWAGSFIDPLEYRRKSKRDARSEQSLAVSEGDDSKCIIKGNINSRGEKIYHTPWGSGSYKKTKVSLKSGERWFCSEADALAAGWRAPR